MAKQKTIRNRVTWNKVFDNTARLVGTWLAVQTDNCAMLAKAYDTDATLRGGIENDWPVVMAEKLKSLKAVGKTKGTIEKELSQDKKVWRCSHVLPRIITLIGKRVSRPQHAVLKVCTSVQKELNEKHKITDKRLAAIVNEVVKADNKAKKPAAKITHPNGHLVPALALIDKALEQFAETIDQDIGDIRDALNRATKRMEGYEYE